MEEVLRGLIVDLLEANKNSLHPSRGAENAKLVRRVCEATRLDEDDFLPRHIRRDKKGWGL